MKQYRVARLLAGARSAGKVVSWQGQDIVVEEATDAAFAGMDIVLGAAENDIAERFAPAIVRSGAVFVDNSSAFRLDPNVPLVVPEINPGDVKLHHGIISNPNCSTTITLTAINALRKLSPIHSMVVSTYQAVSGAGTGGPIELQNEIDALRAKEMERLETLAGLSQEDAREVLLHKVDEELTHEKAVRIAAYETDLKENCDNIARNLIGQAVSRCAADHCSETTVSVVPLPSDEMKGRIIGREGRNIRALETATGVDLIIDDTPEAITLSSFDQTRREVARMTLERLIGDGRIHPARIEETVEKCRHDLELQMKREGERAVMELGIHGLHPDLIKLIGRLKYRTSFGQNALTHSMEVAWLAGLLAGEMGVNVTLARRAGLLHDIGKALDHEIEGSHVQIGVDICRKYKENTQVIHAIEAHHGDVEPKTPLAFIIQACDAISAARPGARRENVESYVKRLENLEEISSSFEGVEQAFAVQAGREVRIMVKPDVISDDQVILLARSIAKKIEDTLDYPGQIKVNVIRESRAVEYAK